MKTARKIASRVPKSLLFAAVALVAVALIIFVGLRAQDSGSAAESNPYIVAGYLPTWLKEADNQRIAGITGLDRIYVAFSEPAADGTVTPPAFSKSSVQTAKDLSKQAGDGVYLSIGGHGGSNEDSTAIKAGFAWGLDNPAVFTRHIESAADAVRQQTGLPKVGVDIDFEYPTTGQAKKLPALIAAMQAAGIDNISMAVAADYEHAAGIQSVARTLAGLGVHFNVMTYDMHGPWSKAAGPITTRAWTVATIDGWIKATGNASRVSVGFPSYCYQFIGANASGDAFDMAVSTELAATQPLYVRQISAANLTDNAALGSSESRNPAGWTACLSPDQAKLTMQAVRQRHPSIGGAFLWDLNGITQDYPDALSVSD